MSKHIWEMTLAEFMEAADKGKLHQATGQLTAKEVIYLLDAIVETPLGRGLAAGYSEEDIAHFYASRRGAYMERKYIKKKIEQGYNPWEVGFLEMMEDARTEGFVEILHEFTPLKDRPSMP